MKLSIVIGVNESQIEQLLKNRASFEVIGLRGCFNTGIKHIESRIERQGLKCRVKTDTKGALAQGGILGTIIGVASLPASVAIATAATIASAGHTLATYNPDYEIIKNYVNNKLKVIYKNNHTPRLNYPHIHKEKK